MRPSSTKSSPSSGSMTLLSASSTSSVVSIEASLRCGFRAPTALPALHLRPDRRDLGDHPGREAIGVLPTIGLLILDSIIGAWLMRSQGRIVWRRFNEALASGRVPAREVLDGTLVIFGGALPLAPGFVTDAFGLFLVLPPPRAVVRRILVRRLTPPGARRVAWAVRRAGAAPRRGGPRPGDVEGTATEVEVDPPALP